MRPCSFIQVVGTLALSPCHAPGLNMKRNSKTLLSCDRDSACTAICTSAALRIEPQRSLTQRLIRKAVAGAF
jgi:hypothetical protein